jgi:hypothetical protein
MHLRKILLATIAVAIITFSVGLRGQGLVDGIKITLPEPVTVDDKVLQPGEYEIRRASQFQDQILRIFNKDKMVYEAHVITIPAAAEEATKDKSKVVLHHIGENFYFDKVWIEGNGYEFRLPERVEALQRELALAPEKAETSPATTQDQVAQAPVQHEGPGLSQQLDALAAQQDRDRQAALTPVEQPREEPTQVAALQQEQTAVTPSQSISREPVTQPGIQSDTQVPEQLPETATNWLAFMIGGLALLTLSLFVRPRLQE